MMTIVFLQDLSLSWALKGSKQGKSGGKENREIIEMGQYGWTLCQVLVLFSFCLVLLLTLFHSKYRRSFQDIHFVSYF